MATEFATIHTNTLLATYAVTIQSTNVVINATAAGSGTTTYKISATLMKD